MKSIILFSFIIIVSCAGRSITDPLVISNDLNAVKKSINNDRNYILKIKNMRQGKSGFYYILDNDGKVIYHPHALLVGRSFKKFWFVKGILKNKSGCYRYVLGNREHLIFFDKLNKREIICLSIPSAEVINYSGKCKAISRQE
ncbi:hypothetical protein ACFL20_05325 [Spirochaetota bacterium]